MANFFFFFNTNLQPIPERGDTPQTNLTLETHPLDSPPSPKRPHSHGSPGRVISSSLKCRFSVLTNHPNEGLSLRTSAGGAGAARHAGTLHARPSPSTSQRHPLQRGKKREGESHLLHKDTCLCKASVIGESQDPERRKDPSSFLRHRTLRPWPRGRSRSRTRAALSDPPLSLPPASRAASSPRGRRPLSRKKVNQQPPGARKPSLG